MKKLFKSIKAFAVNSLNTVAPYTVVNEEFKKEHYVWTWNAAMEWVACYDAQAFGSTGVFNFNGEVAAIKGN